jgi:NADH-quinone oxidoreductase subunit C
LSLVNTNVFTMTIDEQQMTIFMTNEEILNKLKENFADAIISNEEQYGMLSVTLNKEQIMPVMHFLFNDEALNFKFLTDLCGIHYPDNKGAELGVVYHLHNMMNNFRLRLKCLTGWKEKHLIFTELFSKGIQI